MRAQLVCAALVVALVPSSVGAQSISITEAEALARLTPDNPRVRAIQAPIDLVRADVLAARRWPNPRVMFDRESVAGVTEHLTRVGQVLPITGRRRFDISAASVLVDASSSRADDYVRRARADLRLAFGDLLFAQRRERELTRARDGLRDLAEMLSRREAAGEAAGFDRLRAEREVLDLEVERIAAIADRSRAQGALGSFLVNVDDVAGLGAVPSDAPRSIVPPVQELIARAETSRGELRALRHEIESAHFAERAAGRRVIPEPELIAGTKSSTVGRGDVGSVLSVQLAIPLFDRSQSDRTKARARAALAEAEAHAFRIALRAEITALRALVVDRRDAADRYRAAAIASADQIERIAQVSYEAGERGILELLDAYRSASTARVRQASLDAMARQAEIELEFVSGWEMR